MRPPPSRCAACGLGRPRVVDIERGALCALCADPDLSTPAQRSEERKRQRRLRYELANLKRRRAQRRDRLRQRRGSSPDLDERWAAWRRGEGPRPAGRAPAE